jgi:dihydrolipoamide dehydrogenase
MALRITVIGSGPGGFAAAIEGARRGAQVTLIERDSIGGTCLNRGCIPTKTWKNASRFIERLGNAEEFKPMAGVKMDLAVFLARKNTVVESLRKGMLSQLGGAGVRILEGGAEILDTRTVSVRLRNGTTEQVIGDRLILAVGSSPAGCAAFPFDRAGILSTDDAVNLDHIPESILIVGGGVNGCEFASILSAFGTRVTMVEALPRILPMEGVEADTSRVIGREMKKKGIAVITGHRVLAATPCGGSVHTTLAPSPDPSAGPSAGSPQEIDTETMLVTLGRCPAGPGPGLERIGAELDKAGWIAVNDRMETKIPGVYAVGDMLGPSRMMFAYTATAEGMVAAANALGDHEEMNYRAVPFAVFTTPEAAGVGLTEAQARALDPDAGSNIFPIRALGMAQAAGETAGQIKIVSDRGGKVLGVHIVGAHASELIAEGALALRMGATVRDLAAAIHIHPSFSEGIGEAARAFKTVDHA